MLNEVRDAILQREQFRTQLRVVVLVGHQRDAVDREAALQCGHLEELVEDDLGVGVFLHIDDDAHALTAGLIVDVGNALQLTFLHEVGNVFNELLLVDTIRNLGDDNLVVCVVAFNLSLGAHDDASAAGGVGFLDALQAVDIGTGGEVGRRDILHQPIHVDVGVVDISAASVDNLVQVMRRNVGSHTHGDTVSAVDQQVRNLRRHDGRFL